MPSNLIALLYIDDNEHRLRDKGRELIMFAIWLTDCLFEDCLLTGPAIYSWGGRRGKWLPCTNVCTLIHTWLSFILILQLPLVCSQNAYKTNSTVHIVKVIWHSISLSVCFLLMTSQFQILFDKSTFFSSLDLKMLQWMPKLQFCIYRSNWLAITTCVLEDIHKFWTTRRNAWLSQATH